MKVTCGSTIPITLYGLPPRIEDLLKAMKEISASGFPIMEMEITLKTKYHELKITHPKT
jgi:hypothetical protein